MHLAPTILGSYTVKQLQTSADETILVVGTDRLGRRELSAVGCFNYQAARNLSAILKTLQIPNLKYLFEHVPPASLALPHMGVISLAVLGAAFESRRIGGDAPLVSWVRKHATGGDEQRAMVTFHTLKVRELAEASKEKREIKARAHGRRNQAHKLRVTRFTDRQARQASA